MAGISTATVHPRQEARCINAAEVPYNACGDGKTLNTAALQRAIDDCGPGECVYLPAGVYLTSALKLHSHMTLWVEEGADDPEALQGRNA